MGVSAATATAIAAGVSAAAGVSGAVMSSRAQSNAANALRAQNLATSQAQNQAFGLRNQAAMAQTDAQRQVMQQSIQDRLTAAGQARQAQASALQRQQDVLTAENQQAAALRATGDTNAQALLDQTSGANLQGAQDASRAQAAALLSQAMPPSGPQVTDPSGDAETKSAISRRVAEAATNIRDYGSKIAQVQSYQAPLQATSDAITASKIGIMPAQTAEAILRSGTPFNLMPSEVAYTGATNLGAATDAMLQARGQSALDTAGLEYGNRTSIANLTQQDATTLAANAAAQAKANAQAQAATGGIISGVGNLGMMTTGYFGSGGKLSNLFQGFGSDTGASPPTTPPQKAY